MASKILESVIPTQHHPHALQLDFPFHLVSNCLNLPFPIDINDIHRSPRAVDIRSDRIVLFRQWIDTHPSDDGGVVHTRAVVDERQGCIKGLLLLLAGVAPAVRGVGQGRYQGAAGPAPPGTEGEVVAGLHDCARTGIGDCPYASQMVGDVMIDRVTRYRS